MENPYYKDNLILKLTFEFAVDIIRFCEVLEENKKYILGRQLLKSGTSIGANLREAQNCESKADFIHKTKISAKEADETEYWLLLCHEVYKFKECRELLTKLTIITKIINKIIVTSKKKTEAKITLTN